MKGKLLRHFTQVSMTYLSKELHLLLHSTGLSAREIYYNISIKQKCCHSEREVGSIIHWTGVILSYS